MIWIHLQAVLNVRKATEMIVKLHHTWTFKQHCVGTLLASSNTKEREPLTLWQQSRTQHWSALARGSSDVTEQTLQVETSSWGPGNWPQKYFKWQRRWTIWIMLNAQKRQKPDYYIKYTWMVNMEIIIFLKTKVHWDSAMSQVNQLVSGIHETWLPNPTFFAASRRIMMNSRRMEREENKSP